MPAEPTRKPRARPKPYARKPGKAPVPKDPKTGKPLVAPRTAAKPIEMKRHENLTLHDWMVIFAFMDKHPHISQGDVVKHFASKKDGALVFNVAELVKRKRIIGCPPSLEDLVNPAEEQEIGDSPYKFEGGDAEIVAEVRHEMAVERGEIIDDKDESDDEDDADVPSRQEVMRHCEILEKVCFRYGGEEFSLELPRQLRKYRAELLREDLLNSTQTSLDAYFTQRSCS